MTDTHSDTTILWIKELINSQLKIVIFSDILTYTMDSMTNPILCIYYELQVITKPIDATEAPVVHCRMRKDHWLALCLTSEHGCIPLLENDELL